MEFQLLVEGLVAVMVVDPKLRMVAVDPFTEITLVELLENVIGRFAEEVAERWKVFLGTAGALVIGVKVIVGVPFTMRN